MTQRDYEGRIYELEQALEGALELFTASGTGFTTDVVDPDGEILPFPVPEDVTEFLQEVQEVLFGGKAEAEEI